MAPYPLVPSQTKKSQMYVVTEKYICKEKCLSTHYECDGRSGSCICNHALLYNGKNCEHSNIFVSITFASLCFFSLAVVFVALKTLYFKWNCPKKKDWVSVRSSLFASVAGAACFTLCTSVFFRSLNIGNQKWKWVDSVCISVAGLSTVLCCLNVCLMWIELSLSVGGTSPRNFQKSKFVLIVIGLSFTILLALSYDMDVATKNKNGLFFVGIVSASILIGLLQKGSARIIFSLESASRAYLQSTPISYHRTAPSSKRKSAWENDKTSERVSPLTAHLTRVIHVIPPRKPKSNTFSHGRGQSYIERDVFVPFHERMIEQIQRTKTYARLLSLSVAFNFLSRLCFHSLLSTSWTFNIYMWCFNDQ